MNILNSYIVGYNNLNYYNDKCKVVYHLSILYSEPDVKIGNHDTYQAGFGLRSQFGFHDPKGARIGTFDDPTIHSSCMTALESPPGSRYRYCNTLEVFNQNSLYKHNTTILFKTSDIMNIALCEL